MHLNFSQIEFRIQITYDRLFCLKGEFSMPAEPQLVLRALFIDFRGYRLRINVPVLDFSAHKCEIRS